MHTKPTRIIFRLASQDSDPCQALLIREEVERLCKPLDDVDRRLLQGRLNGDRTGDVARELGLDAHFLRARLCRLRKRLRQQLLPGRED